MMDLKEFFLKQRQAAHKGTLEVLAKIPPEQLDWRPAPGMLSLGEITRHIWMSEAGNRAAALEEKWDYYENRVPQGLFAILGEVKSLEDEMAQIEQTYLDTMRQVAAFPIERWEEERSNEKFNIGRRVSVFLFAINEHVIHHRAQVGTYVHILTGGRASPYVL
jgi:uncharacterized damage-inducible protein DinB